MAEVVPQLEADSPASVAEIIEFPTETGTGERWRFRLLDLVRLMLACALVAAAVRHNLPVLSNLSDPTGLILGLLVLGMAMVVGQQISTVPRVRVIVAGVSLLASLSMIYDPNIAQRGDHTSLALCALSLGLFLGTAHGMLYGPLLADVVADAPDELPTGEEQSLNVTTDEP